MRCQGRALLNVQQGFSLFKSLVYGFGLALGFTIVLLIFRRLRERVALARVPAAFAGAPIAFVTISLLALAFMGFGHERVRERRKMLIAIFSLTVLGAVLGVVLGIANKVPVRVEGNPVVDELIAMMPGLNCGQCGFPVAPAPPPPSSTARRRPPAASPGGKSLPRRSPLLGSPSICRAVG